MSSMTGPYDRIRNHSKRKVAYYYHPDIGNNHYGDGHVMKPQRVKMTNSLVMNYGVWKDLYIYRPFRATIEDMAVFHSKEYLEALKTEPVLRRQNTLRAQQYRKLAEFGLSEGDCPVFWNLMDFCQLSCGGSLAAAQKLNKKQADITINWSGGLHHAAKEHASGFCYTNDIVLAILELLKHHKRVLYVDIDLHHGDGVEEAFVTTDRVFTLSFHMYDGFFFPKSGRIQEDGIGEGKGYSLNIPLRSGINDDQYQSIFKPVIHQVMEQYQPDAIVLQCGADSLSGDRLGPFNLTLKGHGECVRFLRKFNVPMVMLGGGGYSPNNVARCWVNETAIAIDKELPDDLPYSDFFEYFGPNFKLNIPEATNTNFNTQGFLNNLRDLAIRKVKALPAVPSVQMRPIPEDALKCLYDLQEYEKDRANPNRRLHHSIMDDAVHHEAEFYDDEDRDGGRDESDAKRAEKKAIDEERNRVEAEREKRRVAMKFKKCLRDENARHELNTAGYIELVPMTEEEIEEYTSRPEERFEMNVKVRYEKDHVKMQYNADGKIASIELIPFPLPEDATPYEIELSERIGRKGADNLLRLILNSTIKLDGEFQKPVIVEKKKRKRKIDETKDTGKGKKLTKKEEMALKKKEESKKAEDLKKKEQSKAVAKDGEVKDIKKSTNTMRWTVHGPIRVANKKKVVASDAAASESRVEATQSPAQDKKEKTDKEKREMERIERERIEREKAEKEKEKAGSEQSESRQARLERMQQMREKALEEQEKEQSKPVEKKPQPSPKKTPVIYEKKASVEDDQSIAAKDEAKTTPIRSGAPSRTASISVERRRSGTSPVKKETAASLEGTPEQKSFAFDPTIEIGRSRSETSRVRMLTEMTAPKGESFEAVKRSASKETSPSKSIEKKAEPRPSLTPTTSRSSRGMEKQDRREDSGTKKDTKIFSPTASTRIEGTDESTSNDSLCSTPPALSPDFHSDYSASLGAAATSGKEKNESLKKDLPTPSTSIESAVKIDDQREVEKGEVKKELKILYTTRVRFSVEDDWSTSPSKAQSNKGTESTLKKQDDVPKTDYPTTSKVAAGSEEKGEDLSPVVRRPEDAANDNEKGAAVATSVVQECILAMEAEKASRRSQSLSQREAVPGKKKNRMMPGISNAASSGFSHERTRTFRELAQHETAKAKAEIERKQAIQDIIDARFRKVKEETRAKLAPKSPEKKEDDGAVLKTDSGETTSQSDGKIDDQPNQAGTSVSSTPVVLGPGDEAIEIKQEESTSSVVVKGSDPVVISKSDETSDELEATSSIISPEDETTTIEKSVAVGSKDAETTESAEKQIVIKEHDEKKDKEVVVVPPAEETAKQDVVPIKDDEEAEQPESSVAPPKEESEKEHLATVKSDETVAPSKEESTKEDLVDLKEAVVPPKEDLPEISTHSSDGDDAIAVQEEVNSGAAKIIDAAEQKIAIKDDETKANDSVKAVLAPADEPLKEVSPKKEEPKEEHKDKMELSSRIAPPKQQSTKPVELMEQSPKKELPPASPHFTRSHRGAKKDEKEVPVKREATASAIPIPAIATPSLAAKRDLRNTTIVVKAEEPAENVEKREGKKEELKKEEKKEEKREEKSESIGTTAAPLNKRDRSRKDDERKKVDDGVKKELPKKEETVTNPSTRSHSKDGKEKIERKPEAAATHTAPPVEEDAVARKEVEVSPHFTRRSLARKEEVVSKLEEKKEEKKAVEKKEKKEVPEATGETETVTPSKSRERKVIEGSDEVKDDKEEEKKEKSRVIREKKESMVDKRDEEKKREQKRQREKSIDDKRDETKEGEGKKVKKEDEDEVEKKEGEPVNTPSLASSRSERKRFSLNRDYSAFTAPVAVRNEIKQQMTVAVVAKTEEKEDGVKKIEEILVKKEVEPAITPAKGSKDAPREKDQSVKRDDTKEVKKEVKKNRDRSSSKDHSREVSKPARPDEKTASRTPTAPPSEGKEKRCESDLGHYWNIEGKRRSIASHGDLTPKKEDESSSKPEQAQAKKAVVPPVAKASRPDEKAPSDGKEKRCESDLGHYWNVEGKRRTLTAHEGSARKEKEGSASTAERGRSVTKTDPPAEKISPPSDVKEKRCESDLGAYWNVEGKRRTLSSAEGALRRLKEDSTEKPDDAPAIAGTSTSRTASLDRRSTSSFVAGSVKDALEGSARMKKEGSASTAERGRSVTKPDPPAEKIPPPSDVKEKRCESDLGAYWNVEGKRRTLSSAEGALRRLKEDSMEKIEVASALAGASTSRTASLDRRSTSSSVPGSTKASGTKDAMTASVTPHSSKRPAEKKDETEDDSSPSETTKRGRGRPPKIPRDSAEPSSSSIDPSGKDSEKREASESSTSTKGTRRSVAESSSTAPSIRSSRKEETSTRRAK